MTPFDVSYPAAVGAGVLTFLSPCILPLVPAYLSFISGLSLEQVTSDRHGGETRRVMAAGVAFVLGLGTVFVLMGAAASGLGQILAEWRDGLAVAGGGLIVLFGLHYIGVFRIAALNLEKRFHLRDRPPGLLGAFAIGLAFGFGWTPCVGPVLATILMVAGNSGSPWYGVSLLAAFAFGLGIPFLVAALAAARFMRFLAHTRHHVRWVERAMGGLLVGTGVLILTGTLDTVSGWLQTHFPALSGLN